MAKNTSKPWFRKVRWSHIGNSWQGALCYVPYVLVLITSLFYVIDRTDSVFEALLRIFPVWVSATVVMEWFASNKIKS